MSFRNDKFTSQNESGVKKNSYLGIVFLIPIFILVLLFMIIPFVNTIIRSFTNYNFIQKAEFIMFENYQNMFIDDVTKIRIENTILALLISVPLTVGISFLFARLSSKLSNVCRYILSVMFLLVSITSITPTGLTALISSEGENVSRLLSSSFFNRLLLILIPLLLGVGPLYLLFSISYLMKDNIIKYLHIAVLLQIAICVLSFYSVGLITGFPSYMYLADNLILGIYDHIMFRFDVGYGSTLMVILAILLIVFTVLMNGGVWLIGKILKRNGTSQIGFTTTETSSNQLTTASSTIIFIFLLFTSLLMFSPFIKTISDSFRSAVDLPTKGWIFSPTLINYKNILSSTDIELQFWPAFLNSLLTLILSSLTLFLVSLLGGISYSMFSSVTKKLLMVFVVLTLFLSPIVFLYISENAIQEDNLIAIVLPIILKSSSFGLCIFLCSVITDHTTRRYRQPFQCLFSSLERMNLLQCILSVSLLASLTAWFHPIIQISKGAKYSLFQLYHRMSFPNFSDAESASVLVLTMLLPIGVIIIFTPLLLKCLHKTSAGAQS